MEPPVMLFDAGRTPKRIAERQEVLDELYSQLFAEPPQPILGGNRRVRSLK